IFFFFFFSSRRRHTRSYGDWSSDVCSSDLAAAVAEILKREGVEFLIGYPVNPIIEAAAEADIRTIIVRQERVGLHMADAVSRVRSEERRVGKECRSRGSADE